jgi:excisionase family DNA binding protein
MTDRIDRTATTDRENIGTVEQDFVSVAEMAKRTTLSQSYITDLQDAGTLPFVRVGSRRLTPRDAFEAWVANLKAKATATPTDPTLSGGV